MRSEHLARVKERLANIYGLNNLSAWIAKNTKYEGKGFSFVGREYQRDIIDEETKTLYVVKCAQVGLSEIFARWALAACVSQDNFTTIYTFPASTDAELFSKSRLQPVIDGSLEIKNSISSTIDSVDLKKFGANSFLYTRGTFSETGALSVPADLIIHDEYDRSDMNNVAAYVSRLQAKPTKLRRVFSTPTVAKYGIDLESITSRRKKQVWTCSCCNHTWLPSYHADVKIPGFDGAKKEINKSNLKDIRWQEAVLLCPACGRAPSPELKYRNWVIENSDQNFDSLTYFVSPFCAPSVISAPYLVRASTEFKKWSEFCNQALGETAEDAEDMLVLSDIQKCQYDGDLNSTNLHFMGADMGLTCHIMIGRVAEGRLIVVHREKVFYTEFVKRRLELVRQYRVLISVHDLFPYTDIITKVTEYDQNAYGAIYVTKKSTETYTIKDQEANPEEGKLNVRSAMVNRDIAFDDLMSSIKAQQVVLTNVDEDLTNQLLSMKRVQKFDKAGFMRYVWEKTDGLDHYHHALLYLKVATGLAGTGSGFIPVGAVPLVTAFRPKIA